ncbi:MAG: hypothetical protein NT154_35550 [Verrucomicrobia bacterium]|nr:hypothetical protein [Verrucomicrobiota bacterium]
MARIEFVLPPAVGDWGIVFFGIGTGDNDGDIFYQSPDAGLLDHPSAALCVWPGVAGGRFACLTNNDVGGTNSYSFFVAGPFSTTNTPGLPDAAQTNSITLRWNPKIKLLSMDCDVNMDSSVDGSAARVIPQEILGAWNTNASSIYYGAGNGVTIRNFSVTLTNFPAPPPTLGIAMHAGITVSGTVGLHYQVQYRTALDPTNSWTLLQDIPVLSTPSVLVYDPAPASSPQRLYQVVQVP